MIRNVDSGHTDIAPPEVPLLPPPAEASGLPPAEPPVKSGFGFFVLLMVLYAGLGGTAQAFHPLAGLLWTEFFVFLLPPLLVASGSNLRPAPFLLLSRRPPSREVILGAASGLALFLVAGAIMSLTIRVVPRSWVTAFDVTHLFEGTGAYRLAMALAASVLAPVAEEVAFRGYLLSALRTHLRPGPAIVGSSVLFACMHLDPVRFPAVLFLGLFLGWLAWRTGSVWPAVAAHAVNNALGSALAAGGSSEPGAEVPLGATLALLVLGLAALAPLVLAWLRATPAPPEGSTAVVLRDPADPSIRFRLSLVPPGPRALAGLGLLLFAALGLYRAAAG
ncbi:MAG: type II CAAX endopeptidase family protein [Deltaproteobacteria bacterium]